MGIKGIRVRVQTETQHNANNIPEGLEKSLMNYLAKSCP